MGDVKELAKSIASFGQLQPIVIDRENNLICGGRRLAACLLAGMKVMAVYSDAVDPLLQREMEVEENIRRKQFTPAEEILATEELHRLKTTKFGEACSGRKGGWTLNQTAEMIGKTRGNVIESLQLAELIKAFPQLKNAKTKMEIKKVAKNLQQISSISAALSIFEKKAEAQEEIFSLKCADSKDWILSIPDGTFDCFITDPPYGINIDKVKMETGKETGGLCATGTKFQDTPDCFRAILKWLPKQLYRVCSETAQGFMFFAPEYYQLCIDAFAHAGWVPYPRPVIWTKGQYHQCNAPHLYPASNYEMILFVRKEESHLYKEGETDVISTPPKLDKIHPTEKPVELIKNLIARIALPGFSLIDPFAGSGAILEAAMTSKLFPAGCEILPDNYAIALSRLTSLPPSTKGDIP